jgi:hypothetical protein
LENKKTARQGGNGGVEIEKIGPHRNDGQSKPAELMGFSGNLRTVPLADLLQLLAASKKTGTLHITQQEEVREVYMRSGMVIYASSTAHEDLLGNILVRRGKISRQQLESAMTAHRQSGRRLGDTLISLGYLTRAEVLDALRFQVEEIVYALFSWSEGDFVFHEDQLPELELMLDPINTINLVMEGTRRIDEWAEIQKSLPSHTSVLRVVSAPKSPRDEIRLSPSEFQTLALIDGERTIGEIMNRSVSGEFLTTKAVNTLLLAGYVEVAGKKRLGMTLEEQEEELLRQTGRLFAMAFDSVWTVLAQRFGKGASEIVSAKIGKRKAAYPVLSQLTWGEGLELDEKSFFTLARQIPSYGRVHRLLASLTDLLDAGIRVMESLLGERLSRSVLREIRREGDRILAAAPDVDGLDLLKEDFERVMAARRA